MNLKTWQTKKHITNKALSDLIRDKGFNCHESMISHYHAGRKCMSPKVAMAIEDITKRKVTLREIFDR